MKTSHDFRYQLDDMWSDIMEAIERLLNIMKGVEFTEDDDELFALIIVEDFATSHIEQIDLTRVSELGILYGKWEDEDEKEIPYDMMSIELLIELLQQLEEYVEVTYSDN